MYQIHAFLSHGINACLTHSRKNTAQNISERAEQSFITEHKTKTLQASFFQHLCHRILD